MSDEKILKLTLEEYSYDLSKLIYPSEGLVSAICEAMDRARRDQCDKIVKKIQTRSDKGIAEYADSERMYKLIKKI